MSDNNTNLSEAEDNSVTTTKGTSKEKPVDEDCILKMGVFVSAHIFLCMMLSYISILTIHGFFLHNIPWWLLLGVTAITYVFYVITGFFATGLAIDIKRLK